MSGPLSGHVVGFIGLGLMGRPMSMNLHAAGAEVVIHNRSRAVVDALTSEGLSPAYSPREVAERAPVVIVMATDTPAVERIVNADNGVASGIAPESLVIDMGTTAVQATRAQPSESPVARSPGEVQPPSRRGSLPGRRRRRPAEPEPRSGRE